MKKVLAILMIVSLMIIGTMAIAEESLYEKYGHDDIYNKDGSYGGYIQKNPYGPDQIYRKDPEGGYTFDGYIRKQPKLDGKLDEYYK